MTTMKTLWTQAPTGRGRAGAQREGTVPKDARKCGNNCEWDCEITTSGRKDAI